MSEQQSIRDDLMNICCTVSEVDAILASPVIRSIQAEAIRDATRVFATGGWVDTFTAGVVDDVSAVQAADRWFNDRADRIEKGE